jgi:hypothetical protein
MRCYRLIDAFGLRAITVQRMASFWAGFDSFGEVACKLQSVQLVLTNEQQTPAEEVRVRSGSVCTHACVCAHTRLCACAHTHACVRVRTRTLVCVRASVRARTRTQARAHTQVFALQISDVMLHKRSIAYSHPTPRDFEQSDVSCSLQSTWWVTAALRAMCQQRCTAHAHFDESCTYGVYRLRRACNYLCQCSRVRKQLVRCACVRASVTSLARGVCGRGFACI